MLVHEPEAAAIPMISNPQDRVPLKEGNTFIIVDAGGGTADITCHKASPLSNVQHLTFWRATCTVETSCMPCWSQHVPVVRMLGICCCM